MISVILLAALAWIPTTQFLQKDLAAVRQQPHRLHPPHPHKAQSGEGVSTRQLTLRKFACLCSEGGCSSLKNNMNCEFCAPGCKLAARSEEVHIPSFCTWQLFIAPHCTVQCQVCTPGVHQAAHPEDA